MINFCCGTSWRKTIGSYNCTKPPSPPLLNIINCFVRGLKSIWSFRDFFFIQNLNKYAVLIGLDNILCFYTNTHTHTRNTHTHTHAYSPLTRCGSPVQLHQLETQVMEAERRAYEANQQVKSQQDHVCVCLSVYIFLYANGMCVCL